MNKVSYNYISRQRDFRSSRRAAYTSFSLFCVQQSTDYTFWRRRAVVFRRSRFLGILRAPGGGSRQRERQGAPSGPLAPPPVIPGHSRPVGSGLRTRAAIGSGPGWAGFGSPTYKGAAARRGAASSVCVGIFGSVSRFFCGLRSGPERVPVSHGDEGRVRAEGRRPGAGYHPLRTKGKNRRGETGGEAVPAHLCPRAAGGASGRPRHAPGAWVGWSAPPGSSAVRRPQSRQPRAAAEC